MDGYMRSVADWRGTPEPDAAAEPIVLAVGDIEAWRRFCGSIPQYQNLSFVTMEGLLKGALAEYRPDVVVSPLVTPEFDCLDLAHTLSKLEYSGAYRAIAQNLPDPSIIVREVRSHFPHLNFQVVWMSESRFRLN